MHDKVKNSDLNIFENDSSLKISAKF